MTRIVTSRFRVTKRQLGSEVCVEKLLSRKVFAREEGSLTSV